MSLTILGSPESHRSCQRNVKSKNTVHYLNTKNGKCRILAEKKSISLLQSFEQRLFKITGCPAVTVQDLTGRSYFAHQTSVDTSIKVDKFTHDFICRAVSTSLRLICAEALGKHPDWQSQTCEMEAKEASVRVLCHSITGTSSGAAGAL